MQNKLAYAMAALCFALPAGTMMAQANGNAGSQAQSGGGGQMGMLATLDKTVDAKKAKVGDPVVAKTTVDLTDNKGGKVPSGSKLMGHVTEVQAKDGTNQESHLAFSFETLQPKNGGAPIPLKLELAGVAPPPLHPGMADSGGGDPSAGMPSGGGAPSGGNSPTGAGGSGSAPSQSSMPSSMPSGGGDTSAPAASAASLTGSTVRDVTLNGTTLTSTKRNVSISEGSTLTLMLVPQTAQSPAGQ